MDTHERYTLCGSSSYQQKYYFNPAFDRLPKAVKDELEIMCVEFTENVGGVLTIEFNEEGEPEFKVRSAEGDQRFDEVGAGLLAKKLIREKQELMQELTLYFRIVVLGEKA